MVVESGLALPSRLYGWLDELGVDVLGPTDDLYDAFRLARDRRPRLAIVDKRIGVDCRRHIHAMLASLKVPCFDLAGTACRRREGLIALQNAMVALCGFADRPELSLKRSPGTAILRRRTGIAGGSHASSGPHQTA
jgi:hypothetical protein